jgi:hypothetical protein
LAHPSKSVLHNAIVTTYSYSDPNQQSCYNNGYGDTLDPNAYANAYNTASHDSTSYNSGYGAGAGQATQDASAAGQADGSAKGQADGLADGQTDGLTAGYNQCYTPAYNSAYHSTYSSAYGSAYTNGYNNSYGSGESDGYADGYATGHSQGYSVGESDGYTVGYNDGYAANACTTSARVLSLTKRLELKNLSTTSAGVGQDKPMAHAKFGSSSAKWVKKLPNGIKVDLYASAPIRHGLLKDPKVHENRLKAMRELARPGLRGKTHTSRLQKSVR